MTYKRKTNRKSPRLEHTVARQKLYELFIKPFGEHYSSEWHKATLSDTVEAFFNAQTRDLMFCKATVSFTMPGGRWKTESQPFDVLRGEGRRHVKVGDPLVVRVDSTKPDRKEIEFDEQVFVLRAPEFEVIKEKLIEVL